MSGPFAFAARQTMALDQILSSVPTMDGLKQDFFPAKVDDEFDPGPDMKMVLAAFYKTAEGRRIVDWVAKLTFNAPYPRVGQSLESAGIAAAKHEARAAVGLSLMRAIAEGEQLSTRGATTMLKILEKYRPFYEGEGGGAGGGDGGAGGEGGNGNGGGDGGAGAGAAADGNGDHSQSAAAQPYRPEGLPDTMFGKDDRETMDKMAKSIIGYRQKDSERAVPDKVEAYSAFDDAAAPDFLKAHLPQLASDPGYQAVAKVAMENGVPVKTMQAMTTALYQAANDAGYLEAPIDVAAERQALLPESAQGLSKADQDKAIDARMQQNADWVKLMTQPGADGKAKLDAKVGEHAMLMLMDTAAGNQFLEFVRGRMTGQDRAQPLNGGGQGGTGDGQREQLRAQLGAPEMDPQHPKFDRAKYDALDAQYKRLLGD